MIYNILYKYMCTPAYMYMYDMPKFMRGGSWSVYAYMYTNAHEYTHMPIFIYMYFVYVGMHIFIFRGVN